MTRFLSSRIISLHSTEFAMCGDLTIPVNVKAATCSDLSVYLLRETS